MICANKQPQIELSGQADSREAHRRRRRVELLKKVGLFRRIGTPVRIQRAVSLKELMEAYSLVYCAYLEQGYILPDPSGLRLRTFEALPEMATFVAKIDGEVAAVMSAVPDSLDLGLPSDQCFGPELQALRAQGRRVCEVTNLAVSREYRNSSVLFDMMQPCFAQALYFGCDDIFIAISPGHARFFEDIMPFEPCGDRRSYSKDHEDIVEGERMNLVGIERRLQEIDQMLGEHAFIHDLLMASNPFLGNLDEVAENARRHFLDPVLLEELFLRRNNLLLRCNVAERSAIRTRWDDELFNLVYARQSQPSSDAWAERLAGWGEQNGLPAVKLAS
jgi:hypothetical protein